MELSDVQRKLQKLLALSSSPNESEANAAMQKASELMERYGIRTIDVNIETNQVGICTYSVPGYTELHRSWESTLAAAVSDPFDGKAVIYGGVDGGKWSISFISSKSESPIIVDLYKRLRRIISKMSLEYATGRRGNIEAIRASYCHGVIRTIHERLLTIYKGNTSERALVLVKESAILDELKRVCGDDMVFSEPEDPSNKQAYLQGARDGDRVGLRKRLSNT